MRYRIDTCAFHDAVYLDRLYSRAPPWPERDKGTVFVALDGLNFSCGYLKLARRHCACNEFSHFRRHPMTVNVPPGPGMSQESSARRNGEALPQFLGEWSYAIDHAAPVAALLFGDLGQLAEPGNQFGDFTPKRNINSINWKWNNRVMQLREKSATRDGCNRSLMSAVQERLHIVDHGQSGAQDQNMTILRHPGRSFPWIGIQIIGQVRLTSFISRGQYDDLCGNA